MKSAKEILKELQLHPPAARVRDRSVGDEIEWATGSQLGFFDRQYGRGTAAASQRKSCRAAEDKHHH